MTITDVRVRLITSDGASRMKAIAAITIDGVFVVHDIKVLEGEAGLFIAMPSRKSGDGEFRDIAHPINSETRAMVSETVIAAYEKALVAAAVAEN